MLLILNTVVFRVSWSWRQYARYTEVLVLIYVEKRHASQDQNTNINFREPPDLLWGRSLSFFFLNGNAGIVHMFQNPSFHILVDSSCAIRRRITLCTWYTANKLSMTQTCLSHVGCQLRVARGCQYMSLAGKIVQFANKREWVCHLQGKVHTWVW